jgi:dienelactone hydrolase/ketosteroid isomerase-like protein
MHREDGIDRRQEKTMHVQPTLRLLACLLLLLSAGQVFADAAGDIQKLEQQRFTAYVKGDVAALERIFADDLVYIHSNGVSDPKSAVLQSFASGELKISRFDAEDIKVRPIGDVMVATGLVHVDLVNKSSPAKFDMRYSAAYVSQNGQWRLMHIQNARVPAKAAAVAAIETVKMAGGPFAGEYPVAVVKIPVDDAKTKFVAAALFEPEGTGPFPAVIILSGCAGVGPDAGIVRRVNADYLPKGIATLVVESFTPRGIAEVCSDPRILEAIGYRAKDAYAAMTWLTSRSEIDSKHIFLQGYSHGAIAAIAAIDAQWLATHQQKFAGVIAFYPYCSSSTKFSVPTIILVGQSDDWTPARLCEDIVDKTNVEITVYPKAFHAFAAPGLDMMYLGHRLAYDAEATNDAQRRALALIESLIK